VGWLDGWLLLFLGGGSGPPSTAPFYFFEPSMPLLLLERLLLQLADATIAKFQREFIA